MSSKQEMNRVAQSLEGQLRQARATADVQAAGNIYLTAVVKMQARQIARLELRLARVRWPWHRRAWVRVRAVWRRLTWWWNPPPVPPVLTLDLNAAQSGEARKEN